jgi:AraC-like DNA-binding protein
MEAEFPFWIKRTEQSSLSEHGHEFIELVYVVGGKGIQFFDGIGYEIKAGDVFIINPGETHSYRVEAGEQIEIINCLFMPSLMPYSLLNELEITASMDYFYVHPFLRSDVRFNHRLNLHGQDAALVLGLLDQMIREYGQKRVGYTTIIKLQVLELLLLLSRYYTSLQQPLRSSLHRKQDNEMTARRIYGYLERNYHDKITLKSLGELFNVSTRQLNRLMNIEFGTSVIDVLHEIRINRAKHLLTVTDEKIIVIATMVGYEDPSFFSRLFLRVTGCSPSNYRSGLVD